MPSKLVDSGGLDDLPTDDANQMPSEMYNTPGLDFKDMGFGPQ